MNQIWAGLILVSLVFALGNDIHDQLADVYGNDEVYELYVKDSIAGLPGSVNIRFRIKDHAAGFDARLTRSGDRTYLDLKRQADLPEKWALRFDHAGRDRLVIPVTIMDPGSYEAKLPEIYWTRMSAMMQSAFDMAEFAARLALGLIGLMSLWLGMMKIAEASGLVHSLVRIMQPVLRPLFPEVPRDHPAMGAISMNLAANVLGLGNAATPIGIKAMQHLQELNEGSDRASHSMCMFLALNTSSVQLLPPVTVIALLGVGAGGLFASIFLATLCSTIVAILVASWYARRNA